MIAYMPCTLNAIVCEAFNAVLSTFMSKSFKAKVLRESNSLLNTLLTIGCFHLCKKSLEMMTDHFFPKGYGVIPAHWSSASAVVTDPFR
jgi:hypothetical protein